MKQFDLKEYLANPNKKLVTRDGRKVRIICTDADMDYPIIALVESTNGTGEQILSFSKEGLYIRNDICSYDLFFAHEKHEGWVNVSREEYGYEGGFIYDSKEDAEKIAKVNKCCVATIKIEWEE